MTNIIKRAYYLHLIPDIPLKTTAYEMDDFWDLMRKYGKNWEKIRTNDWENDTYTLNWNLK